MASLWQQSQERAAKQMTGKDKQHKDCNVFFTTKFIKSCFMYSCDKHTDTSHTGSYQHHEPVNRVPKIGWASSILPTKLGSANSRSMGTPNCGWLPTGTYINSSPDQGPPTNTLLNREQDPDSHRSAGTSGQRGDCGDTAYTPEFCVPNISGGEKGWGAEASNKPEGSQSVCEDRTLQDGRSSPAPRSFAATGLDGKDGSEGCLPPDSYPPRLSTPPHLQMGGDDLQIPMPALWPLSSTQSVHQIAEASGGFPEADRLSPDYIPGRHTDDAPREGPTRADYPTDLSVVREPGVDGEPEEVHADPSPGVGISGLPTVLSDNETVSSHRETPQDPTGCSENATTSISLSKGNSTVCGESNCYIESYPTGPIALPGSPDANELCPSWGIQSGGNIRQIQHNAPAGSIQQKRSGMVGDSHSGSRGSTNPPTRSINNSALRCFQPGLGGSPQWPIPHRGHMVSGGNCSPHQLSRVASFLPGNQSVREEMAERYSLTAYGQCYSSELYKSERGHSVQGSVSISNNNLDMVYGEKHHSPSRTPSRPPKLAGRRGVQDSEEPL